MSLVYQESAQDQRVFVVLVSLYTYLKVTGASVYYTARASSSYSVCASGCNFVSLAEGFASTTVVAGDILSVQSGYATAADTFPITIPNGYVVDCQLSSAVIGTTTSATVVVTTTNAILRNCNFSNVEINVVLATSTEISGNTFTTSTASKILVISASNISILNNNYLSSVRFSSVASGTFSGNIVQNVSPLSSLNDAAYFYNSSNLTINQNTFTTFNTSSGASFLMFSAVSSTSFIGNTINRGSTNAYIPTQYMLVLDPVNFNINYNYFSVANHSSSTRNTILALNPSTMAGSATTTHNTYVVKNANMMRVYDNGYNMTLSARYNIFYGTDQTCDAIQFSKQGAGTAYMVTLGYNDFYQGNIAINNQTAHTNYTVGATDKAIRPIFKYGDSSSANDAQLVPFSALLDINGSEAMGADTMARDSIINIDDTGTVDYSSVDATSTADAIANLRTGDTINFAEGQYAGFTVSSTTDLAGTVTLRGTVSSTYIDAAEFTNALTLNGVSDNAISNLVFRNASTTASSYSMSALLFTRDGVSYDQSEAVELNPSAAILIRNSTCDVSEISDGVDVTTVAGQATSSWHVALLTVGGSSKLTAVVPSNFANSAAALEEACSGSVTVDTWIPNVFTVSGGNFTYNAEAVAAAGATLNDGFTNPPTITRTYTKYAGIKFVNASSNIITNVTTTNNRVGVWFSGTSNNNVFAESVIQNSNDYDAYSDGSGTANRLKNIAFTIASSSVSGAGAVRALTKIRAFVTNQSGVAIQNAEVSAAAQTTSLDDATSTSLTTDANGYSSFSSYLLAFVMTSASVSETAGGYNPYTFSVASTSSLPALSTTQSLISRNQVVTLTMAPVAVAAATTQYRRAVYTAPTTQASPFNSVVVAPENPVIEQNPTRETEQIRVPVAVATPTTAQSAQPQSTTADTKSGASSPSLVDAPAIKAAPVFIFGRFLSVGSTGVEVRYLQAVLKNLGFY